MTDTQLHVSIPAQVACRGAVVAFSGGLDSTVLLHLLSRMPLAQQAGLRAIHVHHGLHPDADAWAMHCEQVCADLGIPLHCARVNVDTACGDGPEAAARRARYDAFAQTLGDDEALALAQHRDDQAETFVLRALRASGPDGLAAMRPWRRFHAGWLWRPLLDTPPAQLIAYARQHALRWVEDPSNSDTDLDRNFLRHRVLPLLRERWPHADAAFARSAALCGAAVELLADEDARALSDVRGSEAAGVDVARLDVARLNVARHDAASLHVAPLQSLPTARRARVLRRWIDDLGLPPLTAQGLSRIEADLLPASADTRAEFAWGDAVIHRWRNVLHAGLRLTPLPTDWETQWDGSSTLPLPNGGGLSLQGVAGFTAPLRVHARQGGERITLPGRTHSHALKHVLQEQDIAPWLRAAMPLVSGGETLLAAGDGVYSAGFSAWLGQQDARLTWTPLL